MSVKCMTRVWTESTVGGSELLVLLAIADHAHDDGSGAWPSLKTIGRKTKMSKRNVSRVINALVEKGELKRDTGAGPYGTNAYVVLSGLTKKKAAGPKCYLCGEAEGGRSSVVFDRHHPNPEDREHTVLLCRPCHLKVHKLLGMDNLSPPTDGMDTVSTPGTQCPTREDGQGQNVPVEGDKTEGVGTPGDESMDIAMSHDPSISNHQLEPSLEPSELWQAVLDDLKLQTSSPTFNAWLKDSTAEADGNGGWTIKVASPFAVEWLANRLKPKIEEAVKRHAEGVTIEFAARRG